MAESTILVQNQKAFTGTRGFAQMSAEQSKIKKKQKNIAPNVQNRELSSNVSGFVVCGCVCFLIIFRSDK